MNIYSAIAINDVEYAKNYINNNNDLHVISYDILGRYCVDHNRLNILKLLVNSGYDINHQNCWGGSTLDRAVYLHKVDFINYIINLPTCNVSIQTESDYTPLIWSARHKFRSKYSFKKIKEIMLLLIRKGANIYHKDSLRKSAIDYLFDRYPNEKKEIDEIVQLANSLLNKCTIFVNQNIGKFRKCDLDNLVKDVRKNLIY